jgi:co-chaperonin GroES (HSP10)
MPDQKLIPLFDRVVIKFDIDPDAPLEKAGGIIMPEGYRPQPKQGDGFPYYTAKVIAIGPDVKTVQVDHRIAIPRDRVEKFSVGEQTFWQCTEKSIAGILEG